MVDDYTHVPLTLSQKYKLFVMKHKDEVSESFLGDDCSHLVEVEFIKENFVPNLRVKGCPVRSGTYSLTERYMYYRIHWRYEHLMSFLNFTITGIVLPIITSVITTIIMLWLNLPS